MKRTVDAQKQKKVDDRKLKKLQGKSAKVEEEKTKSAHSEVDHIATTAKGKISKLENEEDYLE